MTKLDVSEFPDGGRATLVRRYSPTLTRRQLAILISCPYDRPACIPVTATTRGAALVLVRLGLLERNPTSRDVFRVTQAGIEVVERWKNAGHAA